MGSRDEFHVRCENDGWAITVGDDQFGAPSPTRSMAVWAAEDLAKKRPGSRIVVHDPDGSIVVDYPGPSGRLDQFWSSRPA